MACKGLLYLTTTEMDFSNCQSYRPDFYAIEMSIRCPTGTICIFFFSGQILGGLSKDESF